MSETTVLLLAILGAALALAVSVAVSLAWAAPPAAKRGRAVLPASVICPPTGDVALVEIGFDRATGELAVARCERFPTGAFECDRECFPTQVLTPMVAVAGSPA